MIIVTGGAGFIGSNIVAALNEAGRRDILVVDKLRGGLKWQNLRKRNMDDIIAPEALPAWLAAHGGQVETVIHMGANSSTMATDGDDVLDRNYHFSRMLLDWCTTARVPLIYASSAATYGGGEQGFLDREDLEYLDTLHPLNLYGWSKHLFDKLVMTRREGGKPLPPVCIGLKFFNVFGPNEYHKGPMMSVISRVFDEVKNGGAMRLFRSHREGWADGEQQRDFVYVRDIAAIVIWLLSLREGVGIYNVGSGAARSWNDLAAAIFAAIEQSPRVDYMEMPEHLRERYQYYTCADINRLRALGWNQPMTGLEEAVTDYIKSYLDNEDRYH
ncbi:ADP-glyceromanno-heptose 6-epimerase [Acetobacteraceae bacterium H6797]|nr:ADP-glyceromanno-heptose 6-epimerase [Acetobacteraceae bacterium H6797]